MEEIHERLRAELESRGYTKPVMAARAAGLENSQGLRDVLAGRKRLSTELLALLSSRCGVDADYVTTGVRRGEEHLTHQAQLLRMKVLASVLADELHKRRSSLSEMNFHEALNALWDDWRDDANADRGGLVKRIEKLLK